MREPGLHELGAFSRNRAVTSFNALAAKAAGGSDER